jgi:hypothetical protein
MTSDLYQHEYNNLNHYNHNQLSRFLDKINYPDPRNVNPKDIDKNIRDGIVRINKSDWVWTVFSCSGHTNKFSHPYIVFIVDNKYKGLLLENIYNSFYKDIDNINLPLYGGRTFEISTCYSDNKFSMLSLHISDYKRSRLKEYQSILNNLLLNITLSP